MQVRDMSRGVLNWYTCACKKLDAMEKGSDLFSEPLCEWSSDHVMLGTLQVLVLVILTSSFEYSIHCPFSLCTCTCTSTCKRTEKHVIFFYLYERN